MFRALLITSLILFSSTAMSAPYLGKCLVNFTGDSTLHEFPGTGKCDSFRVDIENGAPLQLLGPVTVDVPVSTMDTDNSRRDKKMREMFDSGQFPHIRAKIYPEDINSQLATIGESNSVESFLTLRIRDTEHRIPVRITGITQMDESLNFRLNFDLSLKSYGLEPPTLLGLIRVDDRVELDIDMALSTL